jgi:hypothetical protein
MPKTNPAREDQKYLVDLEAARKFNQPLTSKPAARYIGKSTSTLALLRMRSDYLRSFVGPRYELSGVKPVYRIADLDEYLNAVKEKRHVSADVGRPPGKKTTPRKAARR